MLRKACFAVGMLALVASVIGGCGPSTTATETPGAAQTEMPAVETPVSTAPPSEVKFATYIVWQDFIDLDPAYAYASEQVALNNCYENLTWYNPPGSEDLLRPGLATSWEKNDDATEWTFHLREGVKFQDGEPFNADAVKASIEHYLAAEGAGCSWIWDAVEEVEVVDDYTVRLRLSYPASMDVIASATFCGGMMSPAVAQQPKEWFDAGHCVGTGPYTIESFEKGQRLVMTRFDDYWGGWQENQFDKVVFEVVTDQVAAMQMMEGGEADFYRDPPVERVAELQTSGDLKIYTQPSFQHMVLMLNTRKAPLDNKLVRQALAYSFPYDQFLQKTEGLYTQSRGAVPAGMWGHGDELFQYTFDLDKAKELLAEAGYPDGGFEITVNYMADWASEGWAVELWSFPLAELGITLKPQAMAFEALWELAKSDPLTAQDVAPVIWWPTWVTPYDPLRNMYHCEDETAWNLAYYCNPDFDNMIDQANELSTTDLEGAKAMFVEAQKILIEDSPAIFVCDFPDIWLVRSDIQGVVDNPAYPNVLFFHDLTTTR
jgi:peptide/nickel transport system substrate-binding protein